MQPLFGKEILNIIMLVGEENIKQMVVFSQIKLFTLLDSLIYLFGKIKKIERYSWF